MVGVARNMAAGGEIVDRQRAQRWRAINGGTRTENDAERPVKQVELATENWGGAGWTHLQALARKGGGKYEHGAVTGES